MGDMHVPVDALYGASTARAIQNFPVAMRPLPPEFIHAYGHLKAACAVANRDLGLLEPEVAAAIIESADEVARGLHDGHFPVDVYQTGSGTSTNMNLNEVIANLASRKLADGTRVHPNDHVNRGQSSNDTFPTAMNLSFALAIEAILIPAAHNLDTALEGLANQWDHVVKPGRTHLMDATPIRMGQVFGGFRQQVRDATHDLENARYAVAHNLPIGGTAVGTGINTPRDFGERVAAALTSRCGQSYLIEFKEAYNHPAAQASRDDVVTAHAAVKRLAIALSRIASDIRLLASGPRCGIGELILPAVQPGSSIMPGKENPVICESAMQVACRVMGNDATISTAALGGVGSILELNVAMPVVVDAFLESVRLLGNVIVVFVDKVLSGLKIDEARCAELLGKSLMNVTALVPAIGYDAAAKVAKQAHAEGKTIREVAKTLGLLDDATLDSLLDFDAMTRPTVEPPAVEP